MEIKYESSRGKISWHIWLGIVLIAASAAIYYVQILIFHKHEETFFHMFQDIAFIPISVLLVTMILESVLNYREKKTLKGKLKLVIGTFFTEMGMELLRILSPCDRNILSFRKVLDDNLEFSEKNLASLRAALGRHDFNMQIREGYLTELKTLLEGKRKTVLRFLENPNLLEDESFTTLLWAVSHLAEELYYRKDVERLSGPDRRHIEEDMARAYSQLIAEWLAYVRHLRVNYPYIFSLVIRINPFDPDSSAEYTEACCKMDAAMIDARS